MPDRLLRAETVAEQLALDVQTLYSWRHRGDGPPSFKIRGAVVYRESELDAWIAAEEAKTRKG